MLSEPFSEHQQACRWPILVSWADAKNQLQIEEARDFARAQGAQIRQDDQSKE